jgi:hypothetical protein
LAWLPSVASRSALSLLCWAAACSRLEIVDCYCSLMNVLRHVLQKSAGKSADKSKYKLIYFNAKGAARLAVCVRLFACQRTRGPSACAV